MRLRRINHLLQVRRPPTSEVGVPATVLLVEEQPHAADAVAVQLQDSRPTHVVWCRGADGQVICAERTRGACPLLGHVDVVLDVRTGDTDGLTNGELGVACAGVSGIPVVAAGPLRPTSNEAPWAVARCTLDEAAEFCLRVLDHPDAWMQLRLEDLVRHVAALHKDEVGDVTVGLVRWTDALTVVIRTQRLPSPATSTAIDEAVRRLTPEVTPQGVDVALAFGTALPTR